MSNGRFLNLTPNIMVKDVNKTIEFYTNYLGFELELSVPQEGKFEWALLRRDEAMLMLHHEESFLKEYPQTQHSMGGALTFYIKVKGIESIYQDIQKDVTVIKKINQTSYGMKEFSIQDNNGFILTLAERTNS